MEARKNPGYKRPAKIPPCPQALCRCGHKREVHRVRGKLTPCYPGYPQPFCPCDKFVLAKPVKKRSKP